MTTSTPSTGGEGWLSRLDPAGSLCKSAKRIIQRRFRSVDRKLAAVVRTEASDPRDIHRLRVSTRRAAAATRVFGELIKPKQARAARKALRGIRRIAGDVRRIDVELDSLSSRFNGGDAAAAGFAVGTLRAGQQRARVELLKNAARCASDQFTRIGRKLALCIDRNDKRELREFAGITIDGCMKQIESATAKELTVLPYVHELRITAKRLRYAAEIFVSCSLPDSFAVLYEQLASIQDRLGNLNDLHELSDRLKSLEIELSESGAGATWPSSIAPRLTALRESIDEELMRRHGEFLRWWTPSTVEALKVACAAAFTHAAVELRQVHATHMAGGKPAPGTSIAGSHRREPQRQGGPVS